jgi:hypothetical protein
MQRIRPFLCAVVLVCVPLLPVFAQDATVRSGSPDVRLHLSGGLQFRGSYGVVEDAQRRERLGWGLRRARLRVLADLGDRFSVVTQFEGLSGNAFMIDLHGAYQINPHWQLRFGRFASAQPRSFIPTGVYQIDAIDRAAIAERWGATTIGSDGRDFGVDARYQKDQLEVFLALENGDGDWGRLRGAFRDGISSGNVAAVQRKGMAATASVAVRPTKLPGVEVGAFGGYNGSRNPNTIAPGTNPAGPGRRYTTGGAHVYYGATPASQPVRLKADLILTRYEASVPYPSERVLGYALFGAARLRPHAEAFVRLEEYAPTVQNREAYLTAGASLSLSALRGKPYQQERLTLAYSLLFPEDPLPRQHLLALQAQLTF